MIDAAALARMKPGSVLINAARGGIVDEDVLAHALRKGDWVVGAALDVFETEPLSKQAAKNFAGLKNLVLTPHIAGVTQDPNIRVSRPIAAHVAKKLTGIT